MKVLRTSVVAVLAVAVMAGCDQDISFEPPPFQVEPPPEYPIAHTFTYVPHEEGPEITSIVVRGQFNDWSGDAMRMTEHEGTWSVTAALEPETYQYKYVFNGDNWADNMCGSENWGNPPGGPIDPNVTECDGENGVVNVDPAGLPAHTFTYVPRDGGPEITSIVVRGTFNDWSGNAMAMTEHEGTWSVTTGLAPETYQYKYVFNGDNWADNMCGSENWGNPAGGPIDPDVDNCDGENAVLVIAG